jgi:hypothetical protein
MYRDDPPLFSRQCFELFSREKSQSLAAADSIQKRYPLLE